MKPMPTVMPKRCFSSGSGCGYLPWWPGVPRATTARYPSCAKPARCEPCTSTTSVLCMKMPRVAWTSSGKRASSWPCRVSSVRSTGPMSFLLMQRVRCYCSLKFMSRTRWTTRSLSPCVGHR
jgi:hypothetical protein